MKAWTGYSFSEAIRLCGVTRSHLVRLLDTHTIPPDWSGGGRSGHRRRLSYRNLVQIATAVRLLNMGFGYGAVRKIVWKINVPDEPLKFVSPDRVVTLRIEMQDIVNAINKRLAIKKGGVQ